MGAEELKKLVGGKRLTIESSLFILALENNQEFPLAAELFRILSKSKAEAYASVLVIIELMNKTYEVGSLERIPAQLDFISGGGLIALVNVDRAIALKAAEIRAKYHLKTPDAIHLATALEQNCELFLTADKDYNRAATSGLKIVVMPSNR